MEFIAEGSITLTRVTFYIEAETLEEARQKCVEGSFKTYDANGADLSNWDISRRTLRGE